MQTDTAICKFFSEILGVCIIHRKYFDSITLSDNNNKIRDNNVTFLSCLGKKSRNRELCGNGFLRQNFSESVEFIKCTFLWNIVTDAKGTGDLDLGLFLSINALYLGFEKTLDNRRNWNFKRTFQQIFISYFIFYNI